MLNHKFGKKSRERLSTCATALQLIMHEALKVSPVDFGVAEGHRAIEIQAMYHALGKSDFDGVTKKGKHNYFPSLAVDIYCWVDGKMSYKLEHVLVVAGVIHAVAERLRQEGKIQSELRWGGNWDRDGEVVTDQSFDDLVHFELVTWKSQKNLL